MRRRPEIEVLWCPNRKNEVRPGWSFPRIVEMKIRELCDGWQRKSSTKFNLFRRVHREILDGCLNCCRRAASWWIWRRGSEQDCLD